MFVALVGSLRSIEGGWVHPNREKIRCLKGKFGQLKELLFFFKEFDGLYVAVWFDSFVVATTNQCFVFLLDG